MTVPALAEQARKDAAWANLSEQAKAYHPDGQLVVAKARAAGFEAEDLAGIGKAGRGYERGRFFLQFGDGETQPHRWVELDGAH